MSRALSRTRWATTAAARARDGGRSRAVGAEAVRRVVGVAVDHLDVLRRDPELVRDDLGERRLVPLALGLHGQPQLRLARRVDAQVAPVGHAEAEDVHVLAGTGADALREERDADPHQLPPIPLLRLLPAQLVVAGDPHRLAQRPRVVAGVVLPTRRRHVRELLGSQQVAQAQLGGVDAELVGQAVDDALDEVHGLGDAERAGVGDAAGRLVRVHAGDLAVGRAVVVRAGEDVEEPGRVLRRLGRGVERPVIGDDVDLDADDLAVTGRRDLAVHVVVPGEPGRHQVRTAVLHPLDRPLGDDRADDGEHVARGRPAPCCRSRRRCRGR